MWHPRDSSLHYANWTGNHNEMSSVDTISEVLNIWGTKMSVLWMPCDIRNTDYMYVNIIFAKNKKKGGG